jgi:RHS repeat-associated protein
VRVPAAAVAEVVVDNTAATLVGSWTPSTLRTKGRFWGSNWIASATGTGADTVTFTPALPTAGRYKVYARWSDNYNRASDAPYTVHHAGGQTTVRVNQKVNGGIWIELGSFDLAPGQNHRVVLSDDANSSNVAADAVRFVLEANARAVVADAVGIVGESVPAGAFAATASSVLREYVTLEGRPLALIENGQVYTVHPDHLGTPQKMTDSNGALVWDAVYKPFGEAEQITGTASNPQRFPGQVYDPETGFHYNYFRDYAPGLGRYVESDPIGLEGGLNSYMYVVANPVRLVDPTGTTATAAPILCPFLVLGDGPLPIGDLICGCLVFGAIASSGVDWGDIAACDNCTAANDNDPIDDDGDVDCGEWLLELKMWFLEIVRNISLGKDATLEKKQYEKSAALFCKFCPELCSQALRF